jgi:Cysteine-rich secretory protein family
MAGTVDSQEILDAHNTYRKEVGTPDLQWSDTLAQSAQLWADHLASIHSFPMQPSGCYEQEVGELLLMGDKPFSPVQLIDLLAGSEKANFKPGIYPDVAIDNSQPFGHYTQVIWGNTMQVGCGCASDLTYNYLVCHYTPMGNVGGENVLFGHFSPVYKQVVTGSGIGGYDLKSAADRAFAFDYDGSGKLDHLVLYRPGTCTMWIMNRSDLQ